MMDAAINYWIPFTVMNLQYFVLTLLLYGYAKLLEMTLLYENLVPFWLKVSLYVVNATLIGVTIALFIIIDPRQWGLYPKDPTVGLDYLFRYIYFGVALGCTLLIIPAYIVVYVRVKRESKHVNQQIVETGRRRPLKIFARQVRTTLSYVN
jgi:hypothetical protein